MSDNIKHECGIALIRLKKPVEYYTKKYNNPHYAFNKLYLLMEKQHNRGQEAAGVGVVKLSASPGEEYIFRERELGANAIKDIFKRIENSPNVDETWAQADLLLGHLRYGTTGKTGISHVHPLLRRDNWRSKNMLLAGNFTITNSDELFQRLLDTGQHPRFYGDTFFLLEMLGHELNTVVEDNYKIFSEQGYKGAELNKKIEQHVDLSEILKKTCALWDGGYVVVGVTGSGNAFVVRDPVGIRPCFFYEDDEIVVVASERPVIQTIMNVPINAVKELNAGEALILKQDGALTIHQVLPALPPKHCSFERIYFSRGSDADIYQERKTLGRMLVPDVLKAVDNDMENTVFSFIPNTSEVAYFGMVQGLYSNLIEVKKSRIHEKGKNISSEELDSILSMQVRSEKVVIKDIKLRTFIAKDESRNSMATHVYDITYGSIRAGKDNLVVIDDSIVRGTTLKQSIIQILDRLEPKKIVVVSSAPQVRYPDCYGIDMPNMNDFIAFKATIALLQEQGKTNIIEAVYTKIKTQENLPQEQRVNYVREIYAPFTQEEIAEKMAEMLTPAGIKAKVQLVFQTLDGLHQACPNHQGDWYFSGHYPTAGGVKFVCNAFVSWYEGEGKFAFKS